MTIILYKTSTDVVALVKDLTLVKSLTGTLREETSITNPSIVVQTLDSDFGNYAYIEEFKRYYFINNVTSIRNGVWRLDMSVDVLMSFKEDILNLECFIARANLETEGKYYDPSLPVKNVFDYDLIPEPNYLNYIVFSKYPSEILEDGSFYITTISNEISTNTFTPNIPDNPLQPSAMNSSIGISTHVYKCKNRNNFKSILKLLSENVNASNIKYCGYVPWNDDVFIEETASISNFAIGNNSVSAAGTGAVEVSPNSHLSSTVNNRTIEFDLSAYAYSTLYDPNTIIELYLPYVGFIELPKVLLSEKKIVFKLNMSFDISSGDFTYYITTDDTTNILSVNNVNVASLFSFVEGNGQEVEARRTANQLSLMNGIFGGIFDSIATGFTISGISGRNADTHKTAASGAAVFKYMGGILDAGLGYAASEVLNIKRSTVNSVDNNFLIKGMPNVIQLKITYHKPSVDIKTFSQYHGLIYNDYGLIKDFKGYIEAGDIHPENLPNCLTSEIEAIVVLLRNGIKNNTPTE